MHPLLTELQATQLVAARHAEAAEHRRARDAAAARPALRVRLGILLIRVGRAVRGPCTAPAPARPAH